MAPKGWLNGFRLTETMFHSSCVPAYAYTSAPIRTHTEASCRCMKVPRSPPVYPSVSNLLPTVSAALVSATQSQDQMQGRTALELVVGCRLVVRHLLATEYETLLCRRNALLLFHALLYPRDLKTKSSAYLCRIAAAPLFYSIAQFWKNISCQTRAIFPFLDRPFLVIGSRSALFQMGSMVQL